MKILKSILFSVFIILFLFPSESSTRAQSKACKLNKSSRIEYFENNKSNSLTTSASSVSLEKKKLTNTVNNNITNKHSFNFNSSETDYTENYFRIDKSRQSLWDGKHWKESRFPLRIYVKESNSKYYKSAYKDYVKYAMDVWRKADDRIQYKFVKSPDDADITVVFIENLGAKYKDDYLGLTDYDTNKNKEINLSRIQISLIKNGDEKISAGEIKATIIHELGHAFGLGHSDNKKDLMYPYISSDHTADMFYDELSTGDKLAIKDVISLSFEDNLVFK